MHSPLAGRLPSEPASARCHPPVFPIPPCSPLPRPALPNLRGPRVTACLRLRLPIWPARLPIWPARVLPRGRSGRWSWRPSSPRAGGGSARPPKRAKGRTWAGSRATTSQSRPGARLLCANFDIIFFGLFWGDCWGDFWGAASHAVSSAIPPVYLARHPCPARSVAYVC